MILYFLKKILDKYNDLLKCLYSKILYEILLVHLNVILLLVIVKKKIILCNN